jgi:hypothetical protein
MSIPVFVGVKIARLISHGIFFLFPYVSRVCVQNKVGSNSGADSQLGVILYVVSAKRY